MNDQEKAELKELAECGGCVMNNQYTDLMEAEAVFQHVRTFVINLQEAGRV